MYIELTHFLGVGFIVITIMFFIYYLVSKKPYAFSIFISSIIGILLCICINTAFVEETGNIRIIDFNNKIIRYGKYSAIPITKIDNVYIDKGLDYLCIDKETGEIELYIWDKDIANEINNMIKK